MKHRLGKILKYDNELISILEMHELNYFKTTEYLCKSLKTGIEFWTTEGCLQELSTKDKIKLL